MTTTAPTPIIRTFDEALYAPPLPAVRHHSNRHPIAHRAAPATRARHRITVVTIRPQLLPRVQRVFRAATYVLLGLCIIADLIPAAASFGALAAVTLAVWLTSTVLNRPQLHRALVRWYLIRRADRA